MERILEACLRDKFPTESVSAARVDRKTLFTLLDENDIAVYLAFSTKDDVCPP